MHQHVFTFYLLFIKYLSNFNLYSASTLSKRANGFAILTMLPPDEPFSRIPTTALLYVISGQRDMTISIYTVNILLGRLTDSTNGHIAFELDKLALRGILTSA